MDSSKKQANQPAPGSIVVGKVELEVEGETVRIHLRDRPGVSYTVSLGQLERWAIRQLREGVFA